MPALANRPRPLNLAVVSRRGRSFFAFDVGDDVMRAALEYGRGCDAAVQLPALAYGEGRKLVHRQCGALSAPYSSLSVSSCSRGIRIFSSFAGKPQH